ncbi:DNA mismatch repair protein MutS [Croceimicrobium hydrocarbonivorans]|uniref:DNA mismatch repair protein MutS n=1 Tax=Croceimicrobium hydrocarbonivorans TaxID=2761580 RepID=A0A7H0VBI5_9FLAO|nr:DNA mismatch repair protein MutS [Croceimicrobium hydrocarbonivorans]QNR23083.1 DNA mismatch repair protein MutS [Croceimicrobium hydrocarbonivorans]
MQQYNEIKQKHPDAILLFRVGDFYETFGEDAIAASRILGIVLTKRANGSASEIELAGFPHHSLDTYLPKLVRTGRRVAICDQLEDPKQTKTIVKRGITELVTPGLTTHDQVLNSGENNFLAAVHMGASLQGVAFCDLSTGEFMVAQGNHEQVDKLLQSLRPTEVLYSKSKRRVFEDVYASQAYSFPLDEWIFQFEFAEQSLLDHFKVKSLKGFGIEAMEEAIIASGAIFHYLKETHHNRLDHIQSINRLDNGEYVWMDRFTVRNLELFESNSRGGQSLLGVINETCSPMGSRLMQRWLAMPLVDMQRLGKRHDHVEAFYRNPDLISSVREALNEIYDLERLAVKVSTAKVLPKELVQLKRALLLANDIKALCEKDEAFNSLVGKIHPAKDLIARIASTLKDEPQNNMAKGEYVREGVSEELDEYRELMYNGKDKLLEIQQREAEKTGIANLKIAFNNVFGYYLEVRNTHKDKVPEEWIRKQTLVSAERYITQELKEYEQKILQAEEKIVSLEQEIYQQLLQDLLAQLGLIQSNAQVLAEVDCLSAFAYLAQRNDYHRPEMNEGDEIEIKDGRHPVIEKSLKAGDEYVANDVTLDRESQQLLMITGPNMSGKSALLRQTALISLMAQIGSFVPASTAKLGYLDKIFVRVGASDNISQGESTFMVEMNETASILNNLSERSLILLDEIGRGTSTYDGISIAWSIAEYLHEHPSRAKTLFATHYHELNEMEGNFERIRNFNVSVKEMGDKIIFMRKLSEGGSAHSFGIHVARMAGMPALVISRSQKILTELEASRANGREAETLNDQAKEMQLSFFQLDDPILDEIRKDIENLDINTLTPVEALMKLNEIKKKIGA